MLNITGLIVMTLNVTLDMHLFCLFILFWFHNMSDIYNCRGFEILYISGVVNHDESNFGAILVVRLNCQKNLRNQMSSLQHQVYNTCINQFELLASFFSCPEQLNG